MCGITGFYSRQTQQEALNSDLQMMVDALRLRGPDDHGLWVSQQDNLALGHRRLAILDLSPLGHQPMHSNNDRFVIVFNGEIYNYLDIRNDLINLGAKFKGHSDTEVILAAFEHWGVEKSLKKFNGMFAFALWDKKDKKLTLARDPIGEKPLYYGFQAGNFYFGSELKAICANPKFKPILNQDALALFFRFNYIPAPHSIYKNIYKLKPGTFIEFDLAKLNQENFENLNQATTYWSINLQPDKITDYKSAQDSLEDLLIDAVKIRMISDVPIGAFLSGGVDSSCVVALMQKLSSKPIKTFAIGFEEKIYNEAEYAKSVAQHLGTDHTECYVSSKDAMGVIPLLSSIYDEPFSDSSQIPTFLVSKLARQKVTVSLSGDGGDELFAGYSRYGWANSIDNYTKFLPRIIKLILAQGLRSVPRPIWQILSPIIGPIIKSDLHTSKLDYVAQRLAQFLSVKDRADLYQCLMTHWDGATSLVYNSRQTETIFASAMNHKDLTFSQQMRLSDMLAYHPDDILVKLDRASMAVSLESRVPFIDPRIVDFSFRLPDDFLIKNKQKKWILKQILYKYVPKELIDRPKKGFSVPINTWLAGPLRDWAEDLLSEKALTQDGILNPKLVREKWDQFINKKLAWDQLLWDVLIFQNWKKEWKFSQT